MDWNAKQGECTNEIMHPPCNHWSSLRFASGSQPPKNSKHNQSSQCDYTSQTDTPAPVLITSSAVSHFWFTKIPFLDNWRHLLAFGFNVICPPTGATVISRLKTERDENSVWYVLRLRIPQEVPCTTDSDIKCFSYKTIPQITKEKKKQWNRMASQKCYVKTDLRTDNIKKNEFKWTLKSACFSIN